MTYWQEAPMNRGQLVLFADRLEDRIPPNHPVRLLDEILSGMDWSGWEAKYDGHRGQPPIHPSILCKVILYGLIRRVRSSRQLEYSVSHGIDFIWLTSGCSLDHTTISKFRTAHAKELKTLYQEVCRYALHLGVARLAEVCIDGSRVLGNASRYKTWTAERTRKLLEQLDAQIDKALGELQTNDELDEAFDGDSGTELPPEVTDLKARREKIRQIHEQLQEMDQSRKKDGIDPTKNPAQLSMTDPQARILPNKSGGYAPNYTPMVITETTGGFIIHEDVLVGNIEHTCLVSMLKATQDVYEQAIGTALADAAYSTGPNLAQIEELSLELLSPLASGDPPTPNPAVRETPTEPVPDDQIDTLPIHGSTKKFDKSAFIFDAEKNCYYCPAGKELPHRYTEKRNVQGTPIHSSVYECSDCDGCPLAAKCREKIDAKSGRRIRRDEHEELREKHRRKMNDPGIKERYKKRLHYGEVQFAFIKQWMNLRQFLTRGVEKVQQEWTWACLAYNLRKLMSHHAQQQLPVTTNETG